MIEELTKIKAAGDSCGGVVEIVAKGVPAGLGTGLRQAERDDRPCHVVHRGRKGIEFGDGFEHVRMTGSEANDTPYFDEESGRIRFRTNRAGGLLGGISNGEDIRVRVAVKPTPTILKSQETVDVAKLENITHVFASRSDPTICTRIYPVCEAMMRLVLVDAIYMAEGYRSVTSAIDPGWEDL